MCQRGMLSPTASLPWPECEVCMLLKGMKCCVNTEPMLFTYHHLQCDSHLVGGSQV